MSFFSLVSGRLLEDLVPLSVSAFLSSRFGSFLVASLESLGSFFEPFTSDEKPLKEQRDGVERVKAGATLVR